MRSLQRLSVSSAAASHSAGSPLPGVGLEGDAGVAQNQRLGCAGDDFAGDEAPIGNEF